MRNIGFIILLIIFFISCQNQTNNSANEYKWVYVEVDVGTNNVTHFLYGQVLKSNLDYLKSNSDSEKLFFIKNVRIIGDDDIVKDISIDSNETGSYYYKIKKIKYIEVLKKDPIHLKVETDTIEN